MPSMIGELDEWASLIQVSTYVRTSAGGCVVGGGASRRPVGQFAGLQPAEYMGTFVWRHPLHALGRRVVGSLVR